MFNVIFGGVQNTSTSTCHLQYEKKRLINSQCKIPPLSTLNHRPSNSHLCHSLPKLQKFPTSSATALCALEPVGHEDADTVWSRFWDFKANCSTWHTAASMSLSGISSAANWGSARWKPEEFADLETMNSNYCQLQSVTRHDKTKTRRDETKQDETSHSTGQLAIDTPLTFHTTVKQTHSFHLVQVSLTKQAAARFAWRWTCETRLTGCVPLKWWDSPYMYQPKR